MWRNQVEAGVIEVSTPSVTKEEKENISVNDESETPADPPGLIEPLVPDIPESPVAPEVEEAISPPEEPETAEEVVTPFSEESAPVFPTIADQDPPSVTTPPATVKFETTGTPERSGTPEPGMEGRRKRTLSQTVGKFARRISTSRRGSSTSASELQREGSSASGAAGESSSIDSASKGKKLRKEKKKSIF